MFWKGSGGTSQMSSWRITGIFGNSGYSCAPKLFGPSTVCNALIFCICLFVLFCLTHKIVHAMGRKCRKTTSLASMCVVRAAGWLRVTWPPGRNCWKGFPSCLWFSFLFLRHKPTKCWDTVFWDWFVFGLLGFIPTTTNVTLFFSAPLFPGVRNT